MSNTRYIEVSSEYRDRKLWPLAAEFEIPISQSGLKTINDAIDPVSLSMPFFSWTSNLLLIGSGPQIGGVPTAVVDDNTPIKYASDDTTFVILAPQVFGYTYTFQQLVDYYAGLIIVNIQNSLTSGIYNRRIANSVYLGLDPSGKNRLQIKVANSMSDTFALGDSIQINDPTDFSDPYYPLLYIPNGLPQEDAYRQYIIYNETINQYRHIAHYNNITSIVILDTSGSPTSTNINGPISISGPLDKLWQVTDNFSIRKIPPTLPLLGAPNTLFVNTSTENTITVISTSFSQVNNYYKNSFIRILPYDTLNGYDYVYIPRPINNKASRIVSYSYDTITNTATFIVNPPFQTAPLPGSPIEILPFSYDNFSPFIYSGSLVSQQDMVCYEVQLNSLIVPNATLVVDQGGLIAYYPYIYVQLSNVSASGAGLKNIIYSNNPNASSVIFRSNIYDIRNPLSTPFVRIDGGSMTQTIKFKPNDNLYFKVTMSNGETYKTILEERYSPSIPNRRAQITAVFGFKRIM